MRWYGWSPWPASPTISMSSSLSRLTRNASLTSLCSWTITTRIGPSVAVAPPPPRWNAPLAIPFTALKTPPLWGGRIRAHYGLVNKKACGVLVKFDLVGSGIILLCAAIMSPARGRVYVKRKRERGGRCHRVHRRVRRGRGRAAHREAYVLRRDRPRPRGRVAAVARAAGRVQAACLGRDMGHPARLYPEEAERPSQGRRLHLLSRAGRGVVSHIHADGRYGTFRTEWRSEERRVGKSVDLGGRRIIKKKKKRMRS